MAIGESLHLETMLSQAIPVFLHGLGCATAAVLPACRHGEQCKPLSILPKAASHNPQLHDAIACLTSWLESGHALPAALERPADGLHFHAWRCGEGALLLARSIPFPHSLVMEMKPLALKLGHAITACLQYRDLRQAQEDMQQARDEALAADQAKSRFLATMSHELRTPLNAVINLAELLMDSGLDPRQRQLAEGICEGGRSLSRQVDQVLDFSRLEAKQLTLIEAPLALRSLLTGLAEQFGQQARDKGLDFRLQLSPEAPALITVDGVRLRLVLQSLLENAVKFTETGEVCLVIQVLATEPGPALRFSITDTGIGIDQPAQGKLFQAFYQVEHDLNRRFSGVGLGLALSARLVRLMGGSLECRSRAGEGSHFWFDLPLVRLQRSVARVTGQLDAHVLLVEDSHSNQLVASALLERMGCRVSMVADGLAAVEAVGQTAFDLVLMDVSMPGMDGLEATRQIRALATPHARVPIIAMTAHTFDQDRAACLAAGMNDFLSKPINRERLHTMLACWLKPSSATPPDMATSAPPAREILLDEAVLQQLVTETSPSVLEQVATLFLSESRKHLDRLEQTLAAQQLPQAAKAAHAIKSSAGALGVRQVHGFSSELEQACRAGNQATAQRLMPGLVQALAASRQALCQRLGLAIPPHE